MADGRVRRLATPHVGVGRVSAQDPRVHWPHPQGNLVHLGGYSVAAQKFAFVAIDRPSSKPLEVGAKVWTRFQDNNSKPDPPTNHKIYRGR
jgi:hypothetical protein